jgi:hypothetical protein
MGRVRILLGWSFLVPLMVALPAASGSAEPVVTEFSTQGFPRGITAGPDGNLWYGEYFGQQHRPDHNERLDHGVRRPHLKQPAGRDRDRAGRKPVVH